MLLYNTGIFLYGIAMHMASVFNAKARLWVRGRRGVIGRIRHSVNPAEKIIWFHAASLGEFEQGRPLIEAVRASHPEYKVLLTFFSPSGYEIRRNYDGADWVFYLPLDTPSNARKFLDAVDPDIAVFIKYEFWLNYLRLLGRSGCRTFVVSAIFRRDSVFSKWYGGMFRRALRTFETIAVQDGDSREFLAEIGLNDVVVTGDTRFDRVAKIAADARRLELIEKFAGGRRVFIAGSTWPADEEIILELRSAHPELKFIIVPHETDEHRVAGLLQKAGNGAVRYTALQAGDGTDLYDTLIIDIIGILSSVYRYADFAYIGGGFGAGIHNTLEAAVYGVPVAFGPNYHKFREAEGLIEAGAASGISNADELDAWLKALEHDAGLYERSSAAAAKFVSDHTGATDRIMSVIFSE